MLWYLDLAFDVVITAAIICNMILIGIATWILIFEER